MASADEAAGAKEDPGGWYTVCILHVNLWSPVQKKQNPTKKEQALFVNFLEIETDRRVNNRHAQGQGGIRVQRGVFQNL